MIFQPQIWTLDEIEKSKWMKLGSATEKEKGKTPVPKEMASKAEFETRI